MRKGTLVVVGAVAAIGMATGSALTASNTTTGVAPTAGYGSVSVTGATVSSVDFTHSADGNQIDQAVVVFSGDESANTVRVGFGSVADKACTVGAFDGGSPGTTTATCSALAQDIATANTFNISVVN